MGEIYAIASLDDEVIDYLRSLSVTVLQQPSREPSFSEIENVLSCLDGYSVESKPYAAGASWDADIVSLSDPSIWTQLVIHKLTGINEPQSLSFHKGSPELVASLVSKLSQTCGALVIFSGSGGIPLVVTAEDNLMSLLSRWDL